MKAKNLRSLIRNKNHNQHLVNIITKLNPKEIITSSCNYIKNLIDNYNTNNTNSQSSVIINKTKNNWEKNSNYTPFFEIKKMLKDFESTEFIQTKIENFFALLSKNLKAESIIFPLIAICLEKFSNNINYILDKYDASLSLNNKNIILIIYSLFIVLSKMFEDYSYSLHDLSKVSNIDKHKLIKIEHNVLLLIDYDLFITEDELINFYINSYINTFKNNE